MEQTDIDVSTTRLTLVPWRPDDAPACARDLRPA